MEMQPELQTLCRRMIDARTTLRRVFPMESSYLYPVCANLFCAYRAEADEERLRRCKSLLKDQISAFSYLRGSMILPSAALLAVCPDPEQRLARAEENYALLKQQFRRSSYLALAAILMEDSLTSELAERARSIYGRMRQDHRFLTSAEDSVFALLMACTGEGEETLLQRAEACYSLLRERFSDRNAMQTVSHILAMGGGDPAERVGRLQSFYDGIRGAGGKYARHYEMAVLAALSLLDVEPGQAVAEMLEADELLSRQKGYGGLGIDRRTRMMHAAMLVSDRYAPQPEMAAASLAGTLALIAAQQAALCAIIASSAASASAASHG